MPEVNSRWKHFRNGHIYKVICIGTNSENISDKLVVYQSEYDGQIWIRPLSKLNSDDTRSCWTDEVDDKGTKRFQQV